FPATDPAVSFSPRRIFTPLTFSVGFPVIRVTCGFEIVRKRGGCAGVGLSVCSGFKGGRKRCRSCAEPRCGPRHAVPRCRSHHNLIVGCAADRSRPLQCCEWPESAPCSCWLKTRRMGEDAPKRSFGRVPHLAFGSASSDSVRAGGWF